MEVVLLYQSSHWRGVDGYLVLYPSDSRRQKCEYSLARAGQPTRPSRHRLLHLKHCLSLVGTPMGRFHISLERRTHHCSLSALCRPHLCVHCHPTLEAGERYCSTPDFPQTQHCCWDVVTVLLRLLDDDDGILYSHLVPGDQRCQCHQIRDRYSALDHESCCC